MRMCIVLLSGQARRLVKSRHLTLHKSDPILPGPPRRTSPLQLSKNRTCLMAGIVGLEPTKRESKSRVLPLHHIPILLLVLQSRTALFDTSFNDFALSVFILQYHIPKTMFDVIFCA